MKTLSFAALGAAALLAATPALADPYAFGFSNYSDQQNLVIDGSLISTSGFQGWVSDTLSNTGGPSNNKNYIVGDFSNGSARDYFVFDISDLTSPVTAASLSLYTYTVAGNLTLSLGAASDLVARLTNAESPDPSLYDALGAGTRYGTYTLTAADSNTIYTFTLNAAGLSDLNARIDAGDQYFAIAGSVLAGGGAVPEPATWAMMIGGVGIAGGMVRRSRRTRLTVTHA